MWEYKNATDEQLAEAPARQIMTYLTAEAKEPIDRHFNLQCVADCFSAIYPQLTMPKDGRHRLDKFCFNYQVSDEAIMNCRNLLTGILEDSAGSQDSEKVVAFLKAALLRSPEYLLTLRRSESLVTHSIQIYSDDYSDLLETEVQRVLDNNDDEISQLFENVTAGETVRKKFREFVADIEEPHVRKLVDEEKYDEAFETLIQKDYTSARDFLIDLDADLFASLDFAYDNAVENFNCDLDYFHVPVDGGFIEYADGIGWRNQSGSKIFNLDDATSSKAKDLLYQIRSCDADRTTTIKYRVGEPFLSATEYSHDAPLGTCMTIIPEAWLDDALKFKDIRESFQNNEILRDILSVKELETSLEEKGRTDPLAAMFHQAIKDELVYSYSLVDFYNYKSFDDLAYDAGLRIAKSPVAVKQPKKVLAAIYDLLPKDTFKNTDSWNSKDAFEKEFYETVEDIRRKQSVVR